MLAAIIKGFPAASSGGGVFSRCRMASGAAGAAGLYAIGAKFDASWLWGVAEIGGPVIEGPDIEELVVRESRVRPCWYEGSDMAIFSSC